MQQAGNDVTALPRNPHCAPQWPENLYSHRAARLREASCGAATCFRLLNADEHIVADRRDSDTPELEPTPFDANTREGLFMALACCLREIARAADGYCAQEEIR